MAGLSKISKGAAEEEGLSSVRNFSGEASLRGSQNMSEVPKSTPGNSPIAKDFKTEAAQTKTNAVDEKPGILDSTAKTGLKSLNAQRKSAVRKAWKEEKSLVQETGEGTRPWTDSQKAELLKNGKVKDFKGHHINNVNDHPDLAGDSRNIEFLTQKEHLDAHEGNFNNETHGPLIDRTTP